MLELTEFPLRHTFYRVKDEGGNPVYWREVKGGGEGYIIVWPSGTHDHTYHNPESMDFWTDWPWDED